MRNLLVWASLCFSPSTSSQCLVHKAGEGLENRPRGSLPFSGPWAFFSLLEEMHHTHLSHCTSFILNIALSVFCCFEFAPSDSVPFQSTLVLCSLVVLTVISVSVTCKSHICLIFLRKSILSVNTGTLNSSLSVSRGLSLSSQWLELHCPSGHSLQQSLVASFLTRLWFVGFWYSS